MRCLRLGTRMLVLGLLGASSFLYAQDAKQQDKPQDDSRPEAKQDEAKPPKQDTAKPSKQEKQDEKTQQQDEKTRDQNVQGHQEMQDHGTPDHPGQPAAAQNTPQGHPEQAGSARPQGRGGHIPDDKFQAHFGRSHTFRAQSVIVSGQPQFQYGGYSFELVDAWPVGWAYTDDCYIDYIDGEYFLFDLLHPGVRIAVFVVM
jgi:hypothetical protein